MQTYYQDLLQILIAIGKKDKWYQADLDAICNAIDIFEISAKESSLQIYFLEGISNLCEYATAKISRAKIHKYVPNPFGIDFIYFLENEIQIMKINTDYINKYIFKTDITIENIISLLERIEFSAYFTIEESRFEKKVSEYLTDILGSNAVNTQYYQYGNLTNRIDIDLGHGIIGIELKIANQLETSDAVHRLIGQAVYYNQNFYKNRLIVLVAGKNNITPIIQEVKSILENLGVFFIYKQCINSNNIHTTF